MAPKRTKAQAKPVKKPAKRADVPPPVASNVVATRAKTSPPESSNAGKKSAKTPPPGPSNAGKKNAKTPTPGPANAGSAKKPKKKAAGSKKRGSAGDAKATLKYPKMWAYYDDLLKNASEDQMQIVKGDMKNAIFNVLNLN